MRSTARVVGIVVELIVLWLISALALLVLDAVFGGVTLDTVVVDGRATTLPAALALALVFGLLNAILWPLVVRAMAWIGPVMLFVAVFLAGGLLLMLSMILVPVASVDRTFDLFVMAALLSVFSSVVGGVIASRSDTSYRIMQVRRQRFRRRTSVPATTTPGLLCLQIDGLGHGVLRRAIADGVTPTMAKLVRDTHRLVPWHTDWSSQTGASQLGILHGCNHNVPAFRWYDKTTGTVAVFSNPRDNEQREAERADRPGLLAFDGASRGNLFTGGADDNVLVVSRMRGARLGGGAGYASYFFDPSSALRTVVRMIAEIQRELRQGFHQRRRDIRPRVRRGGVYPFVRAFTTVVANDITVAAVVRDLIDGRSIIYADLIGYDEVSHHSGISRPETLAVLTKIDETIRLLLATVEQADRDYRVVLLSDHGQSQGATFSRRYGESLAQLVNRLCGDPERPESEDLSAQADAEGRLYASASMGSAGEKTDVSPPSDRPVVLGSGNLGLISFPRIDGRADTESIEDAYPGLLAGLCGHPGVGFLLVAVPGGGSVVLGADGSVDVATGAVTGTDPLRGFGPDALEKIRRTDTFDNVADIMVGGAYWPETDEVAAFEEQVGSHGGMGGPQSTPFLLFPKDLPHPPDPLHGAEAVHAVLTGWRDAQSPAE
ncbi:alkaline phosphatase family protein [Gordonia sp. NPDC062954]|uniref:alkaline phosphatase family protein n=1 Tax=Gordonia sp. NPDC062954 TaxID=3364003 RepID=UPI0037CA2992